MSEPTTESVVAQATEPSTFDLTKFIQNGAIALPTASIDCKTDLDAGYRIAYELNPKIDEFEKQFAGTVGGVDDDDPTLVALKAERQTLFDRIESTRITFNMRGVAPAILVMLGKEKKRVRKADKLDEEEANAWETIEILRSSVRSVVFHAAGHTTTDRLSHTEMETLFNGLPVDQGNKLFNALNVLCYGVVLGSQDIDAGFPRGAVDAE